MRYRWVTHAHPDFPREQVIGKRFEEIMPGPQSDRIAAAAGVFWRPARASACS
jgi:hypothetical protein